ncbi:Ig-like domain-containing protein [Paenibacillus radicis (ex Xue et al. 2023)]|uniref:Ig-like domain-containing protein n=1 Tax=Paenibacillus radicis (ex Xue et al. 2023) TaxID=2972489 RepID=A0ABT1YRE1_9BACL|nr:Ig-like domain-containing protein [Paenibacillus radicis (ex Xue et al. 2023)]MCR8635747.1 Ig-like domain-containing protein [Paenibacillus radicis (ex Xue et al. 2023)]
MTVYSGFTQDTPDHLLLDAGAFYKNYDIGSATGTLLGATRGGGQFTAKPTIRQIEVDGVKGRAKGLNNIDAWEVSILANMLEITPSVLSAALATGSVDTVTNANYDIVTASNTIQLSHYIDNVTWIGRLSGSNKPVVIRIFNALSTEGITLKTEDKNEGVLPITFMAHYDADNLDTVPFEIYYPKLPGDNTPPTVTTNPIDAATGFSVSGNFVWTFNEPIRSSSLDTANFMVMKASDGTIVPGTLTINAGKTVVTFDPTANLTAATAYIAVCTTGVKDMAGNALAANNITNFTTA